MEDGLSVDKWIKAVGIPLASKCDCCMHGPYETLKHVLAKGDIAREIWRRSYMLVGLLFVEGRSWKDRVEI